MLDERWPDDVEEVCGVLASLLRGECTPARVREAEIAEDGRDRRLEGALHDFGLDALPPDPVLLARVALELGRFLAPTAVIESFAARIVLGENDIAYGLEGPVPAALPRVAVAAQAGVTVVASTGSPRRTTAGDLLVTPPCEVRESVVVAGSDAADRMRRVNGLFAAARLVGAGQGALDLGIEFAKTRTQFGRPIGSFQAVANRLVDSSIALAGADLLVRKSAALAARSEGSAPPPHFAIMTWAKAVSASRLAVASVHQVMGGYGFAMEYDCQLYSRRVRSWSMRLAQVGPQLSELAKMALDPERRDGLTSLWRHDQGLPLPRWATEVDRLALAPER